MQRAVLRGLARRKVIAPKRLCVDETSFRKGHDHVTVVTDPDTHQVLHVSEERKAGSLSRFYSQLSPESLAAIEGVSMDMWPAYIKSTRAYVPYADEKIAFDRFHIAKVLSEALDKVRRQEHKELRAQGNEILKGTRYIWLTAEPKMSSKQRKHFESLRDATLKTAEAWAIKNMAAQLWDARGGRDWVNKVWQDWLEWAQACSLEPIRKAAQTIKEHLWGIVNAIVLKQSNGHAEGMNSKRQRIKRRACGFRNKQRFQNAIYFYLGGLDLYPEGMAWRTVPTLNGEAPILF